MWSTPTIVEMGNIIYNATSGLRSTGSSYSNEIIWARRLQAIVIYNRCRQEINPEPGWGDAEHGTEPATVSGHEDPAILQECRDAAVAGRSIIARAVFTRNGPRYAFFCHPACLRGAQLYRHDWNRPPTRWPMLNGGFDNDTHLVASWGPFKDVQACQQRAMEGGHPSGRIPACRGYIGVYVNFTYLGRAFAAAELGCLPRDVPVGSVRARGSRIARSLDWASSVTHNQTL